MIYNYDNIDTPEFFKQWQEEKKQRKQEENKINIAYWLGMGLITFFSIVGMLTILAIIEMI